MSTITTPISRPVLPILFSAALVTIGNGLYNTLSTLEIDRLTNHASLAGIILSTLYVGLILGTCLCPKLIYRYQHQRSYLLIVLLLMASTIVQALTDHLLIWVSCRLLIGIATGASFVIFETWINTYSLPKKRTQPISLYFCVYYTSLALGQLFLSHPSLSNSQLYTITTLLSLLSLLPLNGYRTTNSRSITSMDPPLKQLPQQFFLSGFGCCCSGMLCGVLLTTLPYVLHINHYSTHDIATLLLTTLFAGTLPQIATGYMCVRFEAKKLLITLSVLIMASVLLLNLCHSITTMYVAAFILGIAVFSIYPVAVHLCLQHSPQAIITSVNSRLLLAYGVGSTISPIIVGLIVEHFGSQMVYGSFYILGGLIILACLLSMGQSLAIEFLHRRHYSR